LQVRSRRPVELGAAWQARNTAQVSNEPPDTRFKIDELAGDGPFPAGRVVLDWPLNNKHRLRFLIAPLGIEETGTASQPIVFQDTTFASGPIKVKYRLDSYRASYRYVFYERERWSWSGGATLNIRDAEIRLQQGTLTRVEKNTGVVPLLALEGQWRFAPGWRGLLDFEGLAVLRVPPPCVYGFDLSRAGQCRPAPAHVSHVFDGCRRPFASGSRSSMRKFA
jgi:hypothetical protein